MRTKEYFNSIGIQFHRKGGIELDGKNLNDFVAFLRCTLPGIDDDINGNITTLQLLIFILLRKYF
jgi:hypothetical protein